MSTLDVAGSSVQAAIASPSGTFSSIWQSMDGYAYGVMFNDIVDLGGIGPRRSQPWNAGLEITWKYQLIAWCVIIFYSR